jgi:hypothetical protein
MPGCCVVPGCSVRGGFKFPTDPKLNKLWRIAVKREGPNKGNHFKSDDFREPVSSYVGVGGKKVRLLAHYAVPSIFPHSLLLPKAQTSKRNDWQRGENSMNQVCNDEKKRCARLLMIKSVFCLADMDEDAAGEMSLEGEEESQEDVSGLLLFFRPPRPVPS